MIELFKYSLTDNPGPLHAGKPDYVVKLPKGRNSPTFHPCIYFATDKNMDTYEAHKYLAITYYPKSCFQYDIDVDRDLPKKNAFLEDNRGIILRSNCDPIKVPRCWPSFGQQGGAREVIIVSKSQNNTTNVEFHPKLMIRPFLDGGETDEFHQDDTVNYSIPIANVILDVLTTFRENGVSFENEEGGGELGATIGSVRPGSGTTINAKLRNKFTSISSGFVIYGSSIRVKLWATLWKDDERNKKRYIYGPLEREFNYNLRYCYTVADYTHDRVKETFKKQLENKYYPYCQLYEIISDLIKKEIEVTDVFFDKNANWYPLP